MKKRFYKQRFTSVVYLLLLLTIFIAGGREQFHNHELDSTRHQDCPVEQLSLNYQTDGVIDFSLIPDQDIIIIPLFPHPSPCISPFAFKAIPRAPPL